MQEARLRNLTYAAPLFVDIERREKTVRADEGGLPSRAFWGSAIAPPRCSATPGCRRRRRRRCCRCRRP